MKNFTLSLKGPLIRTLRAAVFWGIMAMLFAGVGCDTFNFGGDDDVPESASAKEDGSKKASTDLDIGDDCKSHDQCKSKNCYKEECFEAVADDRKDGAVCSDSIQCVSESCEDGKCTAPVFCSNESKDGNETDVDCGGSCPPCAEDKACEGDDDCESGDCGDDNLCAAEKSGMSLRMKLLILETAVNKGK